MAAWEEVVIVPETPASRWARDAQSRGGDWQYTAQAGGLNDQVLTYDADGRLDREYLQRGGDYYVVTDANGVQSLALDADGRNSREYADPATLASAINGNVFEPYDVDTDGDNVVDSNDAAPNDPLVQ